jgi:hypothetical protein
MSQQTDQNYGNHKRFVPLYHFFLLGLGLATLLGSFVNLGKSIMHGDPVYSPSLICALSLCCFIAFLFLRRFALKAQDRAIRGEENFRHYVLTGKPHDARLRMGQIIALRFASDEEFPALAIKAVAENMSPDDIKKAVKKWRADDHRA